jgi:hypothetical protein
MIVTHAESIVDTAVSVIRVIVSTAVSVIRVTVSTNVAVIRVVLGLTVKPPIDRRGSGRRGCSTATYIHQWTEHLSF